MTLEKRNHRAEKYVKGGRKLGNWEMWVALETYMQVRENWQCFHAHYKAEKKLPAMTRREETSLSFSSSPPHLSFLQLQEKFGWDAFKKVFSAYHKMSSFPNNNKEKMNLYAKTFSETVEMNLSEFFKAWGWPISPATEKKLSDLPLWSDHPMDKYN